MPIAENAAPLRSSPPRIALFGAGGYGANHADFLEELHRKQTAVFCAVADPGADRLADVKTRLACLGVEWFTDYRDLLDQRAGQLDAVVISTPIPLHLPMLEAAMGSGLHVLLEKPPVPLIQDFLRLAARPEAARVAVAFKRVGDPELHKLKRKMLARAFGKIRRITCSACWPRLDSYYDRAGWAGRLSWNGMPVLDGPATNAHAHFVHNLMFLAGESQNTFGVPETVRGELYRARPIESYDLCCFSGTWPGGAEFAAAFSHSCRERVEWSIRVEGDRGSAHLGPDGLSGSEKPSSKPDLFRQNWSDFYRFLVGKQPKPETSLTDCRGYVATTNALFASSGKIHGIPEPEIVRHTENGDGCYEVSNIAAIAAEVMETGTPFSRQGLPWAVPGRAIHVADLRALDIATFFAP